MKFSFINRNYLATALFLPVTLAFSFAAQAQFTIGPSAASMGNSGIAAVDPGESQFINPASLGYLQRYYIAGSYALGKHPVDGEMNQWGVTLADGTPDSLIPGSLSYVRRRTDYQNGATDTQQDLSLAFAGFPVPHFALGMMVHRLVDQFYSSSQVGGDYTQYNANLGALWVPNPAFGFGAVAYDIVPTDTSVPAAFKPIPTFGIGANYIYEKVFRARMDLTRPDTRNDDRRMNVGVGIETFFRDDFGFRLGYQWRETANQDILTTGLAYRGPRLSVDYTYQKDVRVAEGSRHLFDLWLPF